MFFCMKNTLEIQMCILKGFSVRKTGQRQECYFIILSMTSFSPCWRKMPPMSSLVACGTLFLSNFTLALRTSHTNSTTSWMKRWTVPQPLLYIFISSSPSVLLHPINIFQNLILKSLSKLPSIPQVKNTAFPPKPWVLIKKKRSSTLASSSKVPSQHQTSTWRKHHTPLLLETLMRQPLPLASLLIPLSSSQS